MLEQNPEESFKPDLGGPESAVEGERKSGAADAESSPAESEKNAEKSAEKNAEKNAEESAIAVEKPPSPPLVLLKAEAEKPFSEQITEWLDAGDRMSESVPVPVADGRRPELAAYRLLRSFVERCRAENFRYRVLIAGAVVLSVMVIGILRHQARQAYADEAMDQPVQAQKAPTTTIAAVAVTAPVAPAAVPTPAAPAPTANPVNTADARPRALPTLASRTAVRVQACRRALGKQNAREAVAACRVVATAAPRSADALVLLAKADLMAGRQSDTLQLARRAVTLNPRYADAYLLVGSVEQTTGHKRDARTAYETYLQLAPRGRHAADVRSVLRSL